MISIPVHEKTEVVIDQIINYKFFCHDCGIVLHISKGFNFKDSFHNETDFFFILNHFENVFVNPERLDTGYADIVQTHISNFEYVSKTVDFEYFSLGASNDLFVRNMPPIQNYDVNYSGNIFENMKNWLWYQHTLNDKYLADILNYFGATISDIRDSQIEGSFYRKEIFQEIVDVLKKFYNYQEVSNKERIIYPREEIYYPTLANILHKNLNNKKINYTFVAWNNKKMVPEWQEILNIATGKMNEIYSVKRILREINDNLRFHISTLIGKYRNKSMDMIKIKMGKVYRNFFNLVAARRRIFICHKENSAYISELFRIRTNETLITFETDDKNQIQIDKFISVMERNRDALFIICSQIYPLIANILIQRGFRENIEFIDGFLLED